MRLFQILTGLLLVIGTMAAGYGQNGLSERASSGSGGNSAQASGETLPKAVYPETGNRLPRVKREGLNEIDKKLYDAHASGSEGFYGPHGIRLYTPAGDYLDSLDDYLRQKSGLDPRLVELMILVTARELDAEYVWTSHERIGLKAGLEPEIIDTVRYRKPVTGLGEKEAVIILLGREALGKHKVSSDTFARALKVFGNQELVNFVCVMGDFASTSILVDTFDQHVRPRDKPLLPIP
jgi:4-carboxymuconolactone decarboxylase